MLFNCYFISDYSIPRRDSILTDEDDNDLYSMAGIEVHQRSMHDLASSHSSDGGDDDDDDDDDYNYGNWSRVHNPQKVLHC